MSSHAHRCMYLQGQLLGLISDSQDVPVGRWVHDAHNALHKPATVSTAHLRMWEISYTETRLSMLYSIEQRVDATQKRGMQATA